MSQSARLEGHTLRWMIDGQPDVTVDLHTSFQLRDSAGLHRVVRVECGKRYVDIYVSPQGRSLRAVLTDKAQMGGKSVEMIPGEWS